MLTSSEIEIASPTLVVTFSSFIKFQVLNDMRFFLIHILMKLGLTRFRCTDLEKYVLSYEYSNLLSYSLMFLLGY